MSLTRSDAIKQARALHGRAIVIDTHCDTTQLLADPNWSLAYCHPDGHVDIPRMREGGVGAMFFAIFAAPPLGRGAGLAAVRHQLNLIEAAVESHADVLALADTARDIRQARLDGKIAMVMAIEGGYLIEDSLDHLREFHQRGATYLTLTHGMHTTWADSAGIHEELRPLHGGLTPFGRDVIRELNRLGMMVDVSHASDETVKDVLNVSVAPIIASHSSCKAVSPHRRNLSDELIKAIAAGGGIVQMNFSAAFIDPRFPPDEVRRMQNWRAAARSKADVDTAAVPGGIMPEEHSAPLRESRGPTRPAPSAHSAKFVPRHITPLSVLVDHFDHALQLVGPDHVGIGSDFDGVLVVPHGMEDCSKLPYLTAELLQRGYSEDDLTRVLGGNVLRVMDACADVAHRLSRGHLEEEFPTAPL